MAHDSMPAAETASVAESQRWDWATLQPVHQVSEGENLPSHSLCFQQSFLKHTPETGRQNVSDTVDYIK